jgi:hypothetical protein
MTDTEIIDWIEKRTERGVAVCRRDSGKWVIDFGLHSYEAKTMREAVQWAEDNEHLQPVS